MTILVSLGLLAAVVIGTIILASPQPPESAQPSATQGRTAQTADFPLYYPRPTPPGFSIEPESIQRNARFASFSIRGPGGKVYMVTQQDLPKDFDPASLSLEEMPPSRIGKSYLTELNHKATGVILAERTMITISATAQGSAEAVKVLLRSF